MHRSYMKLLESLLRIHTNLLKDKARLSQGIDRIAMEISITLMIQTITNPSKKKKRKNCQSNQEKLMLL